MDEIAMAIGVEANTASSFLDRTGDFFDHLQPKCRFPIAAEHYFIKPCGIADLADQFLCGRFHPELQVVALYNEVIQAVAEGASGRTPVGQIQVQRIFDWIDNGIHRIHIL